MLALSAGLLAINDAISAAKAGADRNMAGAGFEIGVICGE